MAKIKAGRCPKSHYPGQGRNSGKILNLTNSWFSGRIQTDETMLSYTLIHLLRKPKRSCTEENDILMILINKLTRAVSLGNAMGEIENFNIL